MRSGKSEAARSGTSEVSAVDPKLFEGFDKYVTGIMADIGVPGMAVAVVKNDRVVFARGYGVRKLAGKEPVDSETLFAIGSTSKAFTSALIGMLVDEGKMQWDGRITDYLKGFELFDPYVTREITLRDFLCHRSGLPSTDMMWHASPMGRDEILRRIRYQPLSHGFRTKYLYQNVGYLAAGQAAAAAAGKSWDDLIEERILVPLEMKSSSSGLSNIKRTDNVAVPHALIDGALTAISSRNIDNIGPAGSIQSSASDMTQWIRLLLKEGAWNGKTLITGQTVNEMLTPITHVPAPQTVEKIDKDYLQFLEYGLGWVVQGLHGRKAVWHTGGIDGMRSFVGLLPEKNVGFVILSNSEAYDQCHTMGLGFKLFDIFLGLEQRDWCRIMLKDRKDRMKTASDEGNQSFGGRAATTTQSLVLEQYCGTYKNNVYGDIKVFLENEHLAIDFGPQRMADLAHWHFDTFQTVWRDPYLDKLLLTFSLDSDGHADKLSLDTIGEFERKP